MAVGRDQYGNSLFNPAKQSFTRTKTLNRQGEGFGNNSAQAMAQMTSDQSSANAANEARYNQLLQSVQNTMGQVSGLYGQAGSALAGQGEAERQRLAKQKAANIGRSEQDLISRGLGNTTVRETTRRGIESDDALANLGLTESLGRMHSGMYERQAGAMGGMGQFQADAILSRRDTAPNQAQYIQLLQQMASNGGYR